MLLQVVGHTGATKECADEHFVNIYRVIEREWVSIEEMYLMVESKSQIRCRKSSLASDHITSKHEILQIIV